MRAGCSRLCCNRHRPCSSSRSRRKRRRRPRARRRRLFTRQPLREGPPLAGSCCSPEAACKASGLSISTAPQQPLPAGPPLAGRPSQPKHCVKLQLAVFTVFKRAFLTGPGCLVLPSLVACLPRAGGSQRAAPTHPVHLNGTAACSPLLRLFFRSFVQALTFCPCPPMRQH